MKQEQLLSYVQEIISAVELFYGRDFYGLQDRLSGILEGLEKEAYEGRLHEYRLDDAKRHLAEYFGHDVEEETAEEIDEDFMERFGGFTFSGFCDKESRVYLLEDIVAQYEASFDCNIPENSTWSMAVDDIVTRWTRRPVVKRKGEKHGENT